MKALVAYCLSAAVDPGSEEDERSEEQDGEDRYNDCEDAHVLSGRGIGARTRFDVLDVDLFKAE